MSGPKFDASKVKYTIFEGSTMPKTLSLPLPGGPVTAQRADGHTLAFLPGKDWAILVTTSSAANVFLPLSAHACRVFAEQLLLASDMLDRQEHGL